MPQPCSQWMGFFGLCSHSFKWLARRSSLTTAERKKEREHYLDCERCQRLQRKKIISTFWVGLYTNNCRKANLIINFTPTGSKVVFFLFLICKKLNMHNLTSATEGSVITGDIQTRQQVPGDARYRFQLIRSDIVTIYRTTRLSRQPFVNTARAKCMFTLRRLK